jgi:hypothetical protein
MIRMSTHDEVKRIHTQDNKIFKENLRKNLENTEGRKIKRNGNLVLKKSNLQDQQDEK